MEMKGKRLLREGCAVVDLRDGGSPGRRSVLHNVAFSASGSPHLERLQCSLITPLRYSEEDLHYLLAGRFAFSVVAADEASPPDRAFRRVCPRQHVFVRLSRLLNHDAATTPALC